MKQRIIKLGQVFRQWLRQFFHRKRLIRYAIYLSILFVLWLCRYPILRGIGNYLIVEDEIEKVDVIFVLGGASEERSLEAAKLYKEGWSKKIICTGEHIDKSLLLMDTSLTEAEITGFHLKNNGVPKNHIRYLNKGTSTREEANYILHLAKKKYKKIMILSSKFHLRRVRRTFNKVFENSSVKLIFRGAPSTEYNEAEWWKYEKGLLMVNNEYVKLLYYWWTE